MKTGDGRDDGKRVRMRDCTVRDAAGNVDWSRTSRDFPGMSEMKRQLEAEKRARGEK